MKHKKPSHRHSPADDRRANGERRTQSRRAHKRVVVIGGKTPDRHDRRSQPRREDDPKH